MRRNKGEKKFNRYTALIVIMFIIIISIATKLFIVQVVKGEEYKEKANSRSIREIPDAAPRGNILDKNGSELAKSKQSFVLVYNPTEESNKVILSTMEKVFEILDKNEEVQQDDLELKINPFRFEFKTNDPATQKMLEIKFKRDKGLNGKIEKTLYKGKKDMLTDAEKAKVDEELLKITPEETFDSMLTSYKIDKSKYSLEMQRRLMLVCDTMKMQSFSGYKSVTIAGNIKRDTAFKFSQMLNDLPGVDINNQPIREYPNKDLGSAFLGYISKISVDHAKYQEKGYDVNSDYVGSSGIESVFEDRLKGSKGGRIVKLNKQGRIIEELGKREPYPGQTIQLTVDKEVQAAAEKSLDEAMKYLQGNPNGGDVNTSNATRGAAVAIDVNTGAVLALASRPGYDPNLFTQAGGLSSDLYKQYFQPDLAEFGKQYINRHGLMYAYPGKTLDEVVDILFPIDKSIKGNTTIRRDMYDIYPKSTYNYATQPKVPPGSTFKPMTAIAGLEAGVINPYTTVMDNGYFDLGGGYKTRFAVGGYGPVNLSKALAVSSNPYFMTVGKLLRDSYGDDSLAKCAWKFGLGSPPNSNVKPSTGIEIPESFGQVFDSYRNKNVYAIQYLWETMSTLKKGESSRGQKFTPIDLYDNSGDSDKVKGLKSDIKKTIQESIKEGHKVFDKKAYEKMLTDLVQADSQYKDKNISEKEIKTIIDVIYFITVSDANSQLRVGANMYNASIGQGISQFTPLQLANYVATIANGGDRYKLHLVDKILDADNKLVQQVKPEIIEKTGVNKENLDAVKYGMSLVDSGEGGTAASVFKNYPKKTAGKTGSATFSNNQDAYGRTSAAVYIGFAPYEKPEIAVAVMVFDGGHGSFVASVAKSMYDAYFKINQNKTTETHPQSDESAIKESTPQDVMQVPE